jgi:hypothetical protein
LLISILQNQIDWFIIHFMSSETQATPEKPIPYIVTRLQVTQSWAERFGAAQNDAGVRRQALEQAYADKSELSSDEKNTLIRAKMYEESSRSMGNELRDEAEALGLLMNSTPDSTFNYLMQLSPLEMNVLSLAMSNPSLNEEDHDVFEERIVKRAEAVVRTLHSVQSTPESQ